MNHNLITAFVVATMVAFAGNLAAQPYHTDQTVSGVQTLKVEGNLDVQQYGGGYGGNLSVVGEAHVGKGGVELPGMPSGVEGYFYGPLKIGAYTNIAEYVFKKTGDNTTGGFLVPLGTLSDWVQGSTVQLDILTGPHDYDSGAAHFTIMSKRLDGQSGLNAVSHMAFGGARGIKIYATRPGPAALFLEYDPDFIHDTVREHVLKIRATTLGSINPEDRGFSYIPGVTPSLILVDSLVSDTNGWGDEMRKTINSTKIELNGDVDLPSGKYLKIGGSPVLTTSSAPLF